MIPQLNAYFRYVQTIKGLDTSLSSAKAYFGTLTPHAVATITNFEGDKQQLYDILKNMLDRLVWQHGPHWTIHQYIPPKVSETNMNKKKVAYFRVIGDVHGKYDKYVDKASEAEYSLQVGDMGFDYSYLSRIDSDKHKVIGGNHDNYTKIACICNPLDTFIKGPGDENCTLCQGKGYVYGSQSKHFLSDYGVWQPPEFEPIFYVRGAWSIDWKYRTPEISWWEDEEIPYQQMAKALEFYKETKPDFVVSHCAPLNIVPKIPFERIFGNDIHNTRTDKLLDEMYNVYQPKIWLFGHFHTDWNCDIIHSDTGKKTQFTCLAELSHKDFEKWI